MSTAAPHPDYPAARMGELLLAGGFVRKRELDNALKLSKRLNQPICQILQGQQRISTCEKRSLLSLQEKLRQAVAGARAPQLGDLGCRLGELLLACGKVTSTQLNKALAEQSQQKQPLGSILLRSGVISLQKLTECLQLQQKLMSAAAAVLLALSGSQTFADGNRGTAPAWGSLQANNFTTQASHSLREGWRKPGFTRTLLRTPYSQSDEILRSKNGKMVLRLTDTGVEFRTFF